MSPKSGFLDVFAVCLFPCCKPEKAETRAMIGAFSFQRVVFYPSLLYTVMMEKVTSRTRFNRVDQAVLLGGLPFRSAVPSLVAEERVKGVIALNQPFELRSFTPTEQEWKDAGVEYLALPTPDYIASPSQVGGCLVSSHLMILYVMTTNVNTGWKAFK